MTNPQPLNSDATTGLVPLTPAEIRRTPWVMDPRSLTALAATVEALMEAAAPRSVRLSDLPPRPRMRVEGDTAHIPVRGYLLTSSDPWLRYFGIEHTGYDEITAHVAEALASDKVGRIRLEVDSPGGMVSGSRAASDAIYSARLYKPVTAHIEDLGASGAYRLASQANRITAGVDAQVGSIGVYTVYEDTSKAAADAGVTVHVVRSGEHKGMGVDGAPITGDQLAAEQEIVDGMAENFVQEIVRGRQMAPDSVRALATGRVWLGAEAVKVGLVDEITGGNNPAAAGTGPQAATETGDTDMADEKVEEAVDETAGDEQLSEAVESSMDEGIRLERERFAALKAEFPEDLPFAAEQYEKGATAQEAKAAYADVLKARLAEAKAEAEKPRAPEPPPAAPAVQTAVDVDSGPAPDLRTLARERAQRKGISMSRALAEIVGERPELRPARPASQR